MRTLVLAVSLWLFSLPAQATVIYDFTANCEYGCEGQIHGVMKLWNLYSPGERAVDRHIRYFQFTTPPIKDLPHKYFAFGPVSVASRFPIETGSTVVRLGLGQRELFQTLVTGKWKVDDDFTPFGGANAVWTYRETTPEVVSAPGTLGLSMLTLGLLIYGRRRLKK